MNENETLTHVRWKRYQAEDVAAVVVPFLAALTRWPYAVPTSADRYKEPEARGMPIADKHQEPGKYTIEMPTETTSSSLSKSAAAKENEEMSYYRRAREMMMAPCRPTNAGRTSSPESLSRETTRRRRPASPILA
jgi:hypothetical protein